MSDKKEYSFNVAVPIAVSIFSIPYAKNLTVNIKTVTFTDAEAESIRVELEALKARAVREFGQEAATLMVFPTPEDIAKLVAFFGFSVNYALETAGGALDGLCFVRRETLAKQKDHEEA